METEKLVGTDNTIKISNRTKRKWKKFIVRLPLPLTSKREELLASLSNKINSPPDKFTKPKNTELLICRIDLINKFYYINFKLNMI
jgi:hypothetical protein